MQKEIELKHGLAFTTNFSEDDEDYLKSKEAFMELMRPAIEAAAKRLADEIDKLILGEPIREDKTTAQLSAAPVSVTKPCGS